MSYQDKPLDMDAVTLLFDKLGIRPDMDDGNLVIRAVYYNDMDCTTSGAMYGWNKTSFARASAMDVLTAINSIINEVEKYAP